MNIRVISYYSPNYSIYAAKLAESLRRWGVLNEDVAIEPVKPFRSWHDGVSYKPYFIRQAMERFTNCDGLLWMDADAYAVRHLPLDDFRGADVAAARFQWTPGHPLEILTGTMFFSMEPSRVNMVKAFVDEWVAATARFTASDTPEQDALRGVITAWKHLVMFEPLSVEWAYIDDERVKAQYPHAVPVVKHTQASRHIRAEEHREALRSKA